MGKSLLFILIIFFSIQQIKSQTKIYGLLNVIRSDTGHYVQLGSELGIGRISARNPDGAGYSSLIISQWNNTDERIISTISGAGNFGIGTTNPGSKLDVNGTANFDGHVYAHAAETNTIAPSAGSISFWGAWSCIRNGTDHSWNIDVYNSSNPINAFKIIQNGNVGIGVTSPLEKLSVEGNISANGYIKAKKLTVTQTVWADYVFNPGYKLQSLSSLELFIRQNKHLPEVPSAKEVEEKGISVGDNQALLLKKIEELTLYMIEMNKANKQMRAEIEAQAKKIQRLQNKNQ